MINGVRAENSSVPTQPFPRAQATDSYEIKIGLYEGESFYFGQEFDGQDECQRE